MIGAERRWAVAASVSFRASPPFAVKVLLRKSPPISGSRSGSRVENHTVALALEQLDRPPPDTLSVATVIVVGAWLTVRGALAQEVIDHPEHCVRHRHHVPRPRRAALDAAPGPRRFDQGRAEPEIASAGSPGSMLAGALIVAGTGRGPTGQVMLAWEIAYAHPSSAMSTSAVRRSIPGIVSNGARGWANG